MRDGREPRRASGPSTPRTGREARCTTARRMRHHGLVTLPSNGLGAAADRLWCRLRLDRLAGGRQSGYVIREDMLEHPDTVRSFRWIRWLLVAETVVGLTAIVVAVLLTARGRPCRGRCGSVPPSCCSSR